jgi:hypothetical protein
MKHGDKAKAKSAKAKASGKEAAGKKIDAKSSKGAEKSSSLKEAGSKAVEKTSTVAKGGNGKNKGVRPPAAPGGFSNPVIGEAFRRAVKKYPTAFRRLTD